MVYPMADPEEKVMIPPGMGLCLTVLIELKPVLTKTRLCYSHLTRRLDPPLSLLRVPTQESGNALVTLLKLRMSMGGDKHLPSNGACKLICLKKML
ncbi:hypothetical protein EVAR_9217_1 [Eumeta japonica]|uniref:Uncharacterized protein n=1 Tax=Eumeta variegata TaxID=151549 RepID=A0A4C1WQB7_EUMVA|nr:hypothetical protein EVAR_9217_1 [Eumeta japonica]